MYMTKFPYSKTCLKNGESYSLISKAYITSSQARYSIYKVGWRTEHINECDSEKRTHPCTTYCSHSDHPTELVKGCTESSFGRDYYISEP